MLDNTGISPEDYAKTWVNNILGLTNLEVVEVAIDRTNWQFGKQDINYFVVSVIWCHHQSISAIKLKSNCFDQLNDRDSFS